ncbi:hypothetical protein MMC2321_02339 [Chitinophaga sp. MM2321]
MFAFLSAGETRKMANFKVMYKNPLLVILITYSEALPIGFAVALVSGFILKKKVKTYSINN